MSATFDELFGPGPGEPENYPDGHCEFCGCPFGVFLEDSRTCYSAPETNRFHQIAEIQVPDPNAPIGLCRECAEEHHANWDAQWADYYAGLM